MSRRGVSRQQSTGSGIITAIRDQRISEADIVQTTAKERSWGALECCVLAVVVAVNAALASWTPLFIPPDGLDYLNGAYTLAHGGGLADFVSYKAPGLTMVLGLAMAVTSHWAVFHALAARRPAWVAGRRAYLALTARRILGVGPPSPHLCAAGSALLGGGSPGPADLSGVPPTRVRQHVPDIPGRLDHRPPLSGLLTQEARALIAVPCDPLGVVRRWCALPGELSDALGVGSAVHGLGRVP